MVRFWVTDAIVRRMGVRFPWGTLGVNASGALLIGLLAALLPAETGSLRAATAWHFGVLGLIGGYTTVSSFSLETLALLHERAWGRAGANVLLSVGLCFAAVGAGLLAGGGLARALS
jgi:fluoride exporter